ncbi:hypothetical protein V5O48_018215 [Marasmius crinis-equi]|uniref:AB hydrolase-1 domain-containing protein n=1 Tax=Marasmius crinis-equi TaxID=585013 RepID=A0ABR3ELS7_9AGAR
MSTIISKNVKSSDGGVIYAEATGDSSKPAIVFAAGYCLPSLVFQKQFEDENLRKNFHLVRYDPRGHGQSVKPETAEGHSSKLYADDFAAVCKAFNVDKPVVAFWSLAGAIVVDICTYLGPEAISGVVYIAAFTHLEPKFLQEIANPEIMKMLPGTQITDDVAAYKKAIVAFSRTCVLNPDSIPLETRYAWLGANLFVPPVVCKLILTRSQDDQKLFDAGKSGKLKVLFLHGNEDIQRNGGMAVVNATKGFFQNPEVAGIDGIGHAPFCEAPEEFNRIVGEFARKVTG